MKMMNNQENSMKDYYVLIEQAVELLKSRNKLNPLNIRSVSENNKDGYIFLVCDTDNGIITSEAAFVVFKVKIPLDDFSSTHRPIDDEASIPASVIGKDDSYVLRIAYRIFKAYKAAREQISK